MALTTQRSTVPWRARRRRTVTANKSIVAAPKCRE
jgi:hypothetical protein